MAEERFQLSSVTIDQFAKIAEPTGSRFNVNVSVPVKASYNEGIVAVGVNVQFFEGEKIILQLEVFCHYEFEPAYWDELTANHTKDAVIKKERMANFFSIAVGTARGVLAAKTENTPFSVCLLPLVNGSPDMGPDFVLSKPK